MTDVTIEVKGESFHAHKLILGARSAVFKAQFSPPMLEAQLGYIKIEDTESEMFRCVLHYLYMDTLQSDPETISTFVGGC
jgi:speckle-type POZ protein